MKKAFLVLLVALCALTGLFAQATAEETSSFVASTSWTAAFADLAGVDDIRIIAPTTLRHPPEYELVPSDIVALQNADYFVYGGYERMMQTIQEGVPSDTRVDIRISTGNNIENVRRQVETIAAQTGTEPRLESYIQTVEEGAARVAELGIDQLRVAIQGMLTPLAEDLGLNIVATFQGELTASQIETAASGAYDLIIDNYHSPSTAPLVGLVDCPIVVWHNFPDTVGRGALEEMVGQNIASVVELYD